eukprot:195301-Pyramimonas_sp.AAC.1
MWEKVAIVEHTEKEQCVQLALPLQVNKDELAELTPGQNWTRQSHGTSVGTPHPILEGYQILPSDPEYGGSVKKAN